MVSVPISCNGAPIPEEWRDVKWDSETLVLNTRGARQSVNFHLEDIEAAFLGRVDGRVHDLVRIAAFAFAADLEVRRGGSKDWKLDAWIRQLALAIPVNEPQFWAQPEVTRALTACLGFVSQDRWLFSFSQATDDEDRQSVLPDGSGHSPEVSSIIPFSGGMDSLTAVAEELAGGRRPLLVSLESSRVAEGHRTVLLDSLRRQFKQQVFGHFGAEVHRHHEEARERTRRTRSFLVAALAFAASVRHGCVDILFSDNGVVSLNLPISDQLIGATATRSTHPKFIRLFNELARHIVPSPPLIRNPLWDRTRVDVLGRLVEIVDPELVGETRSCANTSMRPATQPHCGYCTQCIDRRMAITKCGLEDVDPPERYGFDIFGDELPVDGEAAIAPVAYVRFAQKIADLTDEDVVGSYEELYECLDPASRMSQLGAYLSMLRRHSEVVLDVLSQEAKRRALDMSRGRLPRRSLLSIVATPPEGLKALIENDEGLTHSPDYRVVHWRDEQFQFGPGQAIVVKNLHDAHRKGLEGLSLADALQGSGLNSERMSDALKRSGAWKTLVVPTEKRRGIYRLDL